TNPNNRASATAAPRKLANTSTASSRTESTSRAALPEPGLGLAPGPGRRVVFSTGGKDWWGASGTLV
ncbi:hypothetical protein, partial [Paenarthrobacter sp. NPDC057981]|uniref:hypothetical protein n=1 Tax=Paenarthrobacter sp. NPDC057981 TaxID=3346297 RepID=UPI0036DED11A